MDSLERHKDRKIETGNVRSQCVRFTERNSKIISKVHCKLDLIPFKLVPCQHGTA
jgi:hypothetical protein